MAYGRTDSKTPFEKYVGHGTGWENKGSAYWRAKEAAARAGFRKAADAGNSRQRAYHNDRSLAFMTAAQMLESRSL